MADISIIRFVDELAKSYIVSGHTLIILRTLPKIKILEIIEEFM